MPRRLLADASIFGFALALPSAAAADPAGAEQHFDEVSRHPTAVSIPGADDGTIYLATKPDRASDGSFLQGE